MTNVSSSGLSLGGIPKVALIAPWVASGASKVLIVRSWMSVRDAIRSTPGASPSRLGDRTRRDKCLHR